MATPRVPPAAVGRRPPPPPNPEHEPDEIVGEFRRGKEIGKGSFATVYLAQHRVSLRRLVTPVHFESELVHFDGYVGCKDP